MENYQKPGKGHFISLEQLFLATHPLGLGEIKPFNPLYDLAEWKLAKRNEERVNGYLLPFYRITKKGEEYYKNYGRKYLARLENSKQKSNSNQKQ